nr:hypothetical protein [Evansella caseinilytica]
MGKFSALAPPIGRKTTCNAGKSKVAVKKRFLFELPRCAEQAAAYFQVYFPAFRLSEICSASSRLLSISISSIITIGFFSLLCKISNQFAVR